MINFSNTSNKISNKIVNYTDGIKQYKVGHSVILFLDKYNPVIEVNSEKYSINSINDSNLTKNGYVIIGDNQGKFYYDESTNEIFKYKLAEEASDVISFNSKDIKEKCKNIKWDSR